MPLTMVRVIVAMVMSTRLVVMMGWGWVVRMGGVNPMKGDGDDDHDDMQDGIP